MTGKYEKDSVLGCMKEYGRFDGSVYVLGLFGVETSRQMYDSSGANREDRNPKLFYQVQGSS